MIGVVHAVADVDPRRGGPSRTVGSLCRALAAQGVEVKLVTGRPGTGPADPARRLPAIKVHHVPSFPWGRHRFPRPGPLAEFLENCLGGPDPVVLHDHGIWLPSNHVTARVARSTGVPRVVSPRGMLSDWALRHRSLRKRIAWFAFQRRNLESAAVLHATSEMEAGEIRAVGLECPIAVIPNGVEFPPPLRREVVPSATRRVLFLSRLHPKKGLDHLVAAWDRLRPSGWELVIAGPDENRYGTEIQRKVSDLGLGESVVFEGPVTDRDKWDLYRAADLFVLPTLSENFGVVVGEALACGLPVVTTRAAPWRALEEEGCGWWIETGVEPLEAALRQALGLGDDERQAMGRRGRALVEARFSWEAAASAMLDLYRWTLGIVAEPPGCVRMD